MFEDLKNKVVVITGAGSGIGKSLTDKFIDLGSKVVGVDINSSIKSIKSNNFVPVIADLGSEEGSDIVVRTALNSFGRVDLLINNVGIFPYRGSFLETSLEDWENLFSINFFSAVRILKKVLPLMCEQQYGVIVNITSDLARQPDFRLPDYSASKAALLNLGKTIANEFGHKGIRCNAVAPGPIRTQQWDVEGGFADMLAKEFNMDKEAAIDHFAKEIRKIPVGHIGEPSDVSNLVLFLCSENAKQITGSEFPVNGGIYHFA